MQSKAENTVCKNFPTCGTTSAVDVIKCHYNISYIGEAEMRDLGESINGNGEQT